MTITPETARSFADDATLKVETPTRIEKDQVFYSLVTDDDRTVATDLDKGDAELLAIAPDLAQTIAGMTEEWGVERRYRSGTETATVWFPTESDARREVNNPNRQNGNPRLVRRLVSDPEVIDSE